jgi:hypothetical protein
MQHPLQHPQKKAAKPFGSFFKAGSRVQSELYYTIFVYIHASAGRQNVTVK